MSSLLIEVNLFSVNDAHLCSSRRNALIEYDACDMTKEEIELFLDSVRNYLTTAFSQIRPRARQPRLTGFPS